MTMMLENTVYLDVLGDQLCYTLVIKVQDIGHFSDLDSKLRQDFCDVLVCFCDV